MGTPKGVIAIVVFCSLIAALGGCLSVFWHKWYTFEISGAKTSIGLYSACSTSTSDDREICQQKTFDEPSFLEAVKTAGGCTDPSVANVRIRLYSFRGLTIGGAAFSGLAGVAAVAGCTLTFGKTWAIMTMLSSFLGFGCYVSAFVLWIFTMQKFVFCGKKVCDVFSSVTCSESFGLTFYVACGVAFFNLLNLIFGILCVVLSKPPTPPETKEEKAAREKAAKDEEERKRKEAAAEEQRKTDEAAAAKKQEEEKRADQYKPDPAVDDEDDDPDLWPLPEGDWDYYEDLGLYWSAEYELYFHRASGYYWDPEKEMWYDPESEEWLPPDAVG